MKHAELKTMKSKTFEYMYIMYIHIIPVDNKQISTNQPDKFAKFQSVLKKRKPNYSKKWRAKSDRNYCEID